jgi:hypothetical protein
LLAHKVDNGVVTTVGLRLSEPEGSGDLVGRAKILWDRIQKYLA